jgi:hypothetical protein
MLTNQRIIFNDGGTLVDLSVALNSLYTGNGALPVVAADDALYIGSDLPFNHRWFQIATGGANAAAAAIAGVDVWNGNDWQAAVDVIDQTTATNATLAQSGYISWTRDRSGSWGQEATTEDIPALATLKIYDMYWVRIRFTANLTSSTALSYVGHRFANDADLAGRYPDLNQTAVKTAFAAGKTTWDDQHFLAAEEIIQDIRRKGIAWSPSQILDWQQFNLAAVHKVAQIIMTSFGDDYADNRAQATKDYDLAMNLKVFNVDTNEDGALDEDERRPEAGIYRA